VSAPLAVAPEAGRADRKAFVDLPYRLNRGLEGWVPPLRAADAALMDREKNPFFEHADAQHFLARRGDRVVGRIAAIENRAHNAFHGDRSGFFGWFDCEADPEAATALVGAARAWVAARGLDSVCGPVNYSTNDSCGVLVDGFGPATLMMPWNRPDYDALLKGAGLAPAKDLLAYWVPARPVSERVARLARRAVETSGVVVRPIDKGDWTAEIDRLERLYNRCWVANWGFVPMTSAEFHHTAKDLKFIVDPDVFLVAEWKGDVVGLLGALPDLNETLHGLDGRLFPFGLLKILWRKKRIRKIRVLVMGVVPEVRGKGVDAALLTRLAKNVTDRYECGEASWILEDNERMNRDIVAVGGRVTKRYRLYEGPTRP
jgi:GNAT superfamily N-acetyltransferase